MEQRQITREDVLQFPSLFFWGGTIKVLFPLRCMPRSLACCLSSSTTPKKSTPASNPPPRNLGACFQWHARIQVAEWPYETRMRRPTVDTMSVCRQGVTVCDTSEPRRQVQLGLWQCGAAFQAASRGKICVLQRRIEREPPSQRNERSREAGLRRRLSLLADCHMLL